MFAALQRSIYSIVNEVWVTRPTECSLFCIVPFRRWFTGGDKFFRITHGNEFERRRMRGGERGGWIVPGQLGS